MDDQSWKAEYFKLLNKPRWSEVRREEAFVLREQHIPPTLFKYRDFDKDGYNIANLENGVIRFSSPNCFNDPFDSALSFSAEDHINHLIRNDPSPEQSWNRYGQLFSSDQIQIINASPDPVRTAAEMAVTQSDDRTISSEKQVEIERSVLRKLHDETETSLNAKVRLNLRIC